MKIALLMAFLGQVLFSAEGMAETLNLDDAVAMALANNQSLNAARKDADAAVWGQAQSISEYFPKVYFNNSLTRLDPDTYDKAKKSDEGNKLMLQKLGMDTSKMEPSVYRDTYSSAIQVTQPIFNGGKEIAGIRSATMEKRVQKYGSADTKASTVNLVKKSYFEGQKSASLLKTSQEALALANETLKLTQARYDVGQANKAELLRWESQVAQAEGDLVAAENSLKLALLNLNVIMGADLDKEWEFPEPDLEAETTAITETTDTHDTDLPSYSLISQHPSLLQMRGTVGLSESNRFLAITDILPQANIIFNYAWESNDTYQLDGDKQWTATLSLDIPVFQSLSGAFGITKAQKQVLAARLREDAFRRSFLQRTYTARLNRQAAVQRVVAAKKEMAFAEENMNIVKTRQVIGAATNLDLLDAQLTYIQAKSRMVSATADFRTASAEWEYVTAK